MNAPLVMPLKTLDLPGDIDAFLPCATPDAWVAAASCPHQLATLLIDHANCEKKAAATALSLIHRYTDSVTLLNNIGLEIFILKKYKKMTLNVMSSFFNVIKKFFSFFFTHEWYSKISSVIDIINAAHMKNTSFKSSDWKVKKKSSNS